MIIKTKYGNLCKYIWIGYVLILWNPKIKYDNHFLDDAQLKVVNQWRYDTHSVNCKFMTKWYPAVDYEPKLVWNPILSNYEFISAMKPRNMLWVDIPNDVQRYIMNWCRHEFQRFIMNYRRSRIMWIRRSLWSESKTGH